MATWRRRRERAFAFCKSESVDFDVASPFGAVAIDLTRAARLYAGPTAAPS